MEDKEFDKKSFFWEADAETYNELQKLIKFVSFVSELKECSEEGKIKTLEIINIIKTINKQKNGINFNVCLFIRDDSISIITNRTSGIYLREWSIYLENGVLEITAESRHTYDNVCAYKEHYHYSGGVFFGEMGDSKRIFLNSDINEFVEDALHYESYLTKTLNDIEVDIDVWG